MAEPFSLAVNVIQIISACAATIKTIDHLIKQYKNAATKLESLAAEASLVKATLKRLHELLQGHSSSFSEKLKNDPDLRVAIDRTLTGCWTVFLLLHKELGKLLPEPAKEVSLPQKTSLLFNDEIIQDYRSQIRGHVQGLESDVNCLQAQTIFDTHAILRQVSETLAKIESKTLDIRKGHREYYFPESIYEGFTSFEDDKGFDKEVFDTPAYRAAFMMARKKSVFSGDSSMTVVTSHNGQIQRRPTMDYLSDQSPEQRSSDMGDADLLGGDEIGDLINLVDDSISWTEMPSAQFKDLEGLYWDSPMQSKIPHTLDEDNAQETTIKAGLQMKAIDSNDTDSIRPLNLALNGLTAQDYEDEIAEQVSSRDSGYISTSQSSNIKGESAGQPNIELPTAAAVATHSVQELEEKIPVWTEDQSFGPLSPATTVSRLDSISTSRSGTGTHRCSTNSDGPSRLSPAISLPFSERPLPSDHRLSNSSISTPPSDEEAEDYLFDTMSHISSSLQPAIRLDWAEDVLRHCTISTAHAIRMAKMDPKSKSGKPLVSERETKMMETAVRIVKVLQHAREGRAYFLGARYIEHGEEREALHLLAYRNGYPRSLFYLGKLSEERKLIEEAKKRYEDAAGHEDAACLLALAHAHLNGQIGVKKDKHAGISLLRRAAASADKDCPEPLHDFALLHLEPPASKLKSGFKLSNSKALVSYDPSAAIKLLRKAALLGHAPSQLRLGQLYLSGLKDASIKVSRKASLRRNSHASTSTASTVASDIETDPRLARHYWHLAARRGLAEADYEIARDIVMSTNDTSKLSKEHARLAVAHASRALFDKVPLAYGIMGKIHEDGIGTKRNLEKAETLYFEGGKKGDTWARKRSDELRNRGVGVSGAAAIYKRDGS